MKEPGYEYMLAKIATALAERPSESRTAGKTGCKRPWPAI